MRKIIALTLYRQSDDEWRVFRAGERVDGRYSGLYMRIHLIPDGVVACEPFTNKPQRFFCHINQLIHWLEGEAGCKVRRK